MSEPEEHSVGDGAGRHNEVLEQLLARAGWSPENLGDRLNAIAVEQGLGRPTSPPTPG